MGGDRAGVQRVSLSREIWSISSSVIRKREVESDAKCVRCDAFVGVWERRVTGPRRWPTSIRVEGGYYYRWVGGDVSSLGGAAWGMSR